MKVTVPRCGKCSKGDHLRCEHPVYIEGVGAGAVHTCCCLTTEEG